MRKPFKQHTMFQEETELYDGQSIERYCEQVTATKQPIEATAPMLYTERKEGVRPETDIRTDRWEVAQNAMDSVSKSMRAKRQDNIAKQADEATKKIQGEESKIDTGTKTE